MMKNRKYNLVSDEVIEQAITGDTAALLAAQSLYRQIKRREHRYERAIKRKAAHGCFEVPIGVSAAEQVAKP